MIKRIFCSILLVSTLALTIGLGFLIGILYHYFGLQLEKELKTEASYLSLAVEENGISALETLPADTARVTFIDTNGTVLFDNKAEASRMENHSDRKEVADALAKGIGKDTRQSDTLSEKTVYLAHRLASGKILRVSSTQYNLAALLGGLIQPMLYILLFMVALSAFFAYRLSRKIVSPINELDLDNPEQTDAYEEISPLLTKINKQQKTIRKQLSDARRQQAEFSIITENMNEGLLVIDSQTDLLSCNTSALQLLAAPRAQEHTSVLTLNRSEPFRQSVETVLSGRHTTATLQIGENCCQLIGNPVFRDEETTGAVLLLVDITEKIQRENLRREFTANVSHELKTPLTSISGFAEIIQSGFVKPEDIQKFASRIFDESQRLIALVGDVIKISQLDEGCLPYQTEHADLYLMSKETLERLREPAQKQGVSLFLEGEHALINTTRPILEEILYNLCDNAVKYNHPGGKVTITVLNAKDAVIITVADTGIGIPTDQQKRIFERFYRVDKSHSKEIGGTGLGLSIVKHGAAYLGAKVELESSPGTGSLFRLTFTK